MCAVEAQKRSVRSTVSLAFRTVSEDALDEEVVADYLKKASIETVAHLSIIKAVSNALLMNDDLFGLIATFVPRVVEKEKN